VDVKLCEERRIFRPPVGIEKDNAVRQLLLGCPMDNTSKRRDANSACEEYGRSCNILLKNQIPGWPFDLDSGAKRHRPQHAFERRIAHPRGHHQGFFVRGACDRKTPHISFGIRLRRIEQSHIEILAGLECPSRWLFEPESHGAFRNFLAIFQFAHEAW
jgi:hypothetical protein